MARLNPHKHSIYDCRDETKRPKSARCGMRPDTCSGPDASFKVTLPRSILGPGKPWEPPYVFPSPPTPPSLHRRRRPCQRLKTVPSAIKMPPQPGVFSVPYGVAHKSRSNIHKRCTDTTGQSQHVIIKEMQTTMRVLRVDEQCNIGMQSTSTMNIYRSERTKQLQTNTRSNPESIKRHRN